MPTDARARLFFLLRAHNERKTLYDCESATKNDNNSEVRARESFSDSAGHNFLLFVVSDDFLRILIMCKFHVKFLPPKLCTHLLIIIYAYGAGKKKRTTITCRDLGHFYRKLRFLGELRPFISRFLIWLLVERRQHIFDEKVDSRYRFVPKLTNVLVTANRKS